MVPLWLTSLVPAWLGKAVWRFLSLVVPIPVILILAALAWVHFDKASAIRTAVNDRVKEMVAGAEIAALEARLAAQRDIAARLDDVSTEAQRRLSASVDAQLNLAKRLQAADAENGDLNDNLADLLSRPVARDCTVSPDFIGRLRGR